MDTRIKSVKILPLVKYYIEELGLPRLFDKSVPNTNGAEIPPSQEPEKLDILRRNIDKGLPCGSEEFIERLSKKSGRSLKFLPRGRPRKIPDKKLRPLFPVPFYPIFLLLM